MNEKLLNAEIKVLQEENRLLKSAKTEAENILKEFLKALKLTQKGWKADNKKIDKILDRASKIINIDNDKRLNNTIVRRIILDENTNGLDYIFSLKAEKNANPNILIHTHRYVHRPNLKDKVKLYNDPNAPKYGLIKGSIYEVSIYKNGDLEINERLIVKIQRRKYNLDECTYCLNIKDVIIK